MRYMVFIICRQIIVLNQIKANQSKGVDPIQSIATVLFIRWKCNCFFSPPLMKLMFCCSINGPLLKQNKYHDNKSTVVLLPLSLKSP